MNEIEYLKKWPQSFLTEEENKTLTASFKSIRIFAAAIVVGHLAVLIILGFTLKDESLTLLIFCGGPVLIGMGIMIAFLWFFFLKKFQLDLQDGRKYEITGIITGKNFSSSSSGNNIRTYNFQIDDVLNIKVKRTEYHDFNIGEKIEVKITKNARLNLSLIKVL